VPETPPRSEQPFSEKSFYLEEFRGRTLAFGAPAAALREPAPIVAVLDELAANRTRVVLVSDQRVTLESVSAAPVLDAEAPRLEGAVWRALREGERVGVAVAGSLAPACRDIAVRLGVSKLIWLDGQGGIEREDGRRQSFAGLEELRAWLARGEGGSRQPLLREIEAALAGGIPAINLCSPAGLSEELFTYAGSGTLFTCDRYVEVRRLGVDDYDAADALVARGVAEGYLAPRDAEELERVLARGFGAFIEGRHLAGICALLEHGEVRAGEIVSLYTLTRFLGEGVGAYLVGFALERARELKLASVFACTTSERVADFFQRQGFRRVGEDALPSEKWRGYDPERRARVRCLLHDLG
jgi:amino-acid N-acetyltransferase